MFGYIWTSTCYDIGDRIDVLRFVRQKAQQKNEVSKERVKIIVEIERRQHKVDCAVVY